MSQILTLPRGACPACGRDVALREDATVRKHRSPEGWRCAGSPEAAAETYVPSPSDAIRAIIERAGKLTPEQTAEIRALLPPVR